MTDIILIATIVAFFAAAALLVRVLDRMIANSGTDADSAADPGPGPAPHDQVSPPDVESGRLT
jgi:hypothetical protein